MECHSTSYIYIHSATTQKHNLQYQMYIIFTRKISLQMLLCWINLLCCGPYDWFRLYARWCLQSSLAMLHTHVLLVWLKWKRNIMRENSWRNRSLWSVAVVAFKSNRNDMLALHRCCFSLWNAVPSQINHIIPGEYLNNSIQCFVLCKGIVVFLVCWMF